MDGSVLDILIYVFDHYMLEDQPDVPERDELAQDLTRAGFASDNVERALDWLADLAGERDRPAIDGGERALRVFSESETMRLDAEARGCLLTLERSGILSPLQREIVVERLLALEVEELGIDQVKWVALMVLSSQPGQEMACARMEDIVFADPSRSLH
jgi:Smg protein